MKTNGSKPKAIIFDVDGTLTDSISWLSLTSLLGADKKVHSKIYEDYRNEKLSLTHAKKELITLWSNTGKAYRENIEKIFDNIPLKNDVIDVVEYLKPKYRLCLISGSMDLYIESVARKLNIQDFYANTQLVFDSESKLTDFIYSPDQAIKKVEHYINFANKFNLEKHECAMVGDGENDQKLFEMLGQQFYIENPETAELYKDKGHIKIKELKELIEYL